MASVENLRAYVDDLSSMLESVQALVAKATENEDWALRSAFSVLSNSVQYVAASVLTAHQELLRQESERKAEKPKRNPLDAFGFTSNDE